MHGESLHERVLLHEPVFVGLEREQRKAELIEDV
jgi:hypothetical protein